MRHLILMLCSFVATASIADTLSGGIICRQDEKKPRVLEIERKSSGDLIVRISGYDLFGGQVPNARSIEAVFQVASCEPGPQGHRLDGSLFTCVGPVEPMVRDSNGENISLPAGFQRLYLNTRIKFGWLPRYNELQYSLRLTGSYGELEDGSTFYPDPKHKSECRLMRHED